MVGWGGNKASSCLWYLSQDEILTFLGLAGWFAMYFSGCYGVEVDAASICASHALYRIREISFRLGHPPYKGGHGRGI